jgi:hypothetical protein
LRDRRAVFSHQHARDTVEGAHTLDVLPDNINAGRSSFPDRLMQIINRRLFDTKQPVRRARSACHCVTFVGWFSQAASSPSVANGMAESFCHIEI